MVRENSLKTSRIGLRAKRRIQLLPSSSRLWKPKIGPRSLRHMKLRSWAPEMNDFEAEMKLTIQKSFNAIPRGGQRAYLTAVCGELRADKYGVAETRELFLSQPARTISMGLGPCYAPDLYRIAGESEDVKDVPDGVNPNVLSVASMMWYWGIRTLCPQQYGRG